MSEQPVSPPIELRALDALVGTWRTEGRVLSDDEPPEATVSGTDRYEWLAGGWFLVHFVDVLIGDDKVNVIELIGDYNKDRRAFAAVAYDNTGAVTRSILSVDEEGVWTLVGDPQEIRARLRIAADGRSMEAHWERGRDGGQWAPWMDIRFTRVG